MGNSLHYLINQRNYHYYDEIALDSGITTFSTQKNTGYQEKIFKYKSLSLKISEAESLYNKLMDMKYHIEQITVKYNSLSRLFEGMHCNICYLDFAQRWVYQQDCNKFYKYCIELEARIAEQDESIKRKYLEYCDFVKLYNVKSEEIKYSNNYPGLVTCLLLNRKCPKCCESKNISHSQAKVSNASSYISIINSSKNTAFMAFKIRGLISFYESQWNEIKSHK
ncbi:uncharacterized protein cubi_00580 [Cryptosporidium ubiquitum]|uniref:Uncharacterized protein n=1 Tax=Cryptosporidium ubiquitum TaxID=857276 RepID=A0A1J4MG00_9CRYT|nr:uncharacterized protein cubi_00580 [Cryptosporidium ubiquitum]OII71773.1 hypothetical protein cubi_00580 [Cryptosporidium ubiquitum]